MRLRVARFSSRTVFSDFCFRRKSSSRNFASPSFSSPFPLIFEKEPSLKGLALAETSRGFGSNLVLFSSGLQEYGLRRSNRVPFLGTDYGISRFVPLKWIGLALTKYRFYRTWVTVRPVGSTKSCRPKANPATSDIRLTVQERTRKKARYLKALNDPPVDAVCLIIALLTGDEILTFIGCSTWGTFLLHVLVLEHGRFGLGPRHLTGANHTGVYP
ncbi:hypothetical protein PIB30_025477 [Stylosanthes scabra]|uniref:Transmembrane protein n=1 Tax=Stylosanthes scabra TaxID=79078 RepID=A0ABU6WB14_9FABA|nr:hypothetical protein [Stylosanthes scabra]